MVPRPAPRGREDPWRRARRAGRESNARRRHQNPTRTQFDSAQARIPGRIKTGIETLPGPEVLVALRRCPRRWFTLLRRHDLAMDLMNFRIDLDISENIANANTGSRCMPRRRLAVEFLMRMARVGSVHVLGCPLSGHSGKTFVFLSQWSRWCM